MAVNRDVPIIIAPDTPDATKWSFVNQNFQTLANNLNPYQVSDGSNNILFIGKDSAGNYVMKVAKPGFDAFNATNANLIFNSGQDMLKVVQSGTHVLTRLANTNVQADTVAHGLGFIPTVVFNVEQTTTQPGVWYSGAQNVRINFTTGAIGEMPIVTVDSTNIIFSTIAPTNNGEYPSQKTFTFKYYLLQETAN